MDHFEPSVEDLERAIQFIRKHEADGSCVYVHCRAGHGRSAAAVFAWLLSKDPNVDPKALNDYLRTLRNVRPKLWAQPNIQTLLSRLRKSMDSNDGMEGRDGSTDTGEL